MQRIYVYIYIHNRVWWSYLYLSITTHYKNNYHHNDENNFDKNCDDD